MWGKRPQDSLTIGIGFDSDDAFGAMARPERSDTDPRADIDVGCEFVEVRGKHLKGPRLPAPRSQLAIELLIPREVWQADCAIRDLDFKDVQCAALRSWCFMLSAALAYPPPAPSMK